MQTYQHATHPLATVLTFFQRDCLDTQISKIISWWGSTKNYLYLCELGSLATLQVFTSGQHLAPTLYSIINYHFQTDTPKTSTLLLIKELIVCQPSTFKYSSINYVPSYYHITITYNITLQRTNNEARQQWLRISKQGNNSILKK